MRVKTGVGAEPGFSGFSDVSGDSLADGKAAALLDVLGKAPHDLDVKMAIVADDGHCSRGCARICDALVYHEVQQLLVRIDLHHAGDESLDK